MSDENPISEQRYIIGYCKPPEDGKFKKGESGNPKGRPRGSKKFSTALESELNARVPIIENGRRKKISKMEAIIKQLVNKAASGDPRLLNLLMNYLHQIENLALRKEAIEDRKFMKRIENENPEDSPENICKRIREKLLPELIGSKNEFES